MFKSEITIGDIIQIFVWVAAVIGLIFNYLQMRTNNRQKTAEHIISLNNQFASDKDMTDIYYEIEYGKFKYDAAFHESERETKLDKLLDLYESIAKLYLLTHLIHGPPSHGHVRHLSRLRRAEVSESLPEERN
jgi:hypothetical protein